jgi:hypothetical protein
MAQPKPLVSATERALESGDGLKAAIATEVERIVGHAWDRCLKAIQDDLGTPDGGFASAYFSDPDASGETDALETLKAYAYAELGLHKVAE